MQAAAQHVRGAKTRGKDKGCGWSQAGLETWKQGDEKAEGLLFPGKERSAVGRSQIRGRERITVECGRWRPQNIKISVWREGSVAKSSCSAGDPGSCPDFLTAALKQLWPPLYEVWWPLWPPLAPGTYRVQYIHTGKHSYMEKLGK